jgi:hypothetical protein
METADFSKSFQKYNLRCIRRCFPEEWWSGSQNMGLYPFRATVQKSPLSQKPISGPFLTEMMSKIDGNRRFFKILPEIPYTVHSELFSRRLVVRELKLWFLSTPGNHPKITPQPNIDFWPVFGRNVGRYRRKRQIFQNPSRNTIYGAF